MMRVHSVLPVLVLVAECLVGQHPLTSAETNAGLEIKGMLPSTGTFHCQPWVQIVDHQTVSVGWLSATQALGYVEWTQDEVTWQRADWIEDGLKGSISTKHAMRLTRCDTTRPIKFRTVTCPIERFHPYKVTYGETSRSKEYVIRPLCDHGTVSFMVFNDIHNQVQLYPLLYRALIEPNPVQFVVLNGDIVNDPQTEKEIEENLLAPMAWFASKGLATWFLRGNHETRGAAARSLKSYFQFADNHFYGTFTCGPVAILFLDSGEDKADDNIAYSGLVAFEAYMQMQRAWCERMLASPLFSQSRWRIVIMHIPPDWTRTDDDLQCGMKRLCKDFAPLFSIYRIHAVISGHMHNPQVIDSPAHSDASVTWPILIGGAHPLSRATGIRVDANDQYLTIAIQSSSGSNICTRVFQ